MVSMRLSFELLKAHAGFRVARYELPFYSSVSTLQSLADCYSLSSFTMRSIPARERLLSILSIHESKMYI